MFTLKATPDTLRDTLEPVAVLVDECRVHIDHDGIDITAVDPAHVGMVDISVDADRFDGFEAQEHTIGVPLQKLFDAISVLSTKSEYIYLRLLDDGHLLELEGNGLDMRISLVDPDSVTKTPDLPNVELPATITAEAKHFQKGARACDMVSNHIAVSAAEGDGARFQFAATGDTDRVDITLDETHAIEFSPSNAQSLFNIKYLKEMLNVAGADDEITLKLGDDFPLRVILNNGGNIDATYILAPRIEDE